MPANALRNPYATFPHVHLFPYNPYFSSPPPIAHKVWILDCRACGTFLTNRAMKAVLLLRPNVSLYSSDTLPRNCSAFNPNPDTLCSPSIQKNSNSGAVSRSCECLTQNVCCHGCGTSMGYMIVVPCTRCTNSITTTNRATNGHRFVFHSSQVVSTERHYVKNEPGIIPCQWNPTDLRAHTQSQTTQPRLDRVYTSPPQSGNPDAIASIREDTISPHIGSFNSIYIPNPPSVSPASSEVSRPDDLGQKESGLFTPCLKPGDLVFWHHLSRSGEISNVEDDRRARTPTTAKASAAVFFDR